MRVNAFVNARGRQHRVCSGRYISSRRYPLRSASYLELRVDAFVDAGGMQGEGDGQKGVHLIVLFVDQLHLEILMLEDLKGGNGIV